jgi:hypothetical protein
MSKQTHGQDKPLAQSDAEDQSGEIDSGLDSDLVRLDLSELLANVDPDEIGWDWDATPKE